MKDSEYQELYEYMVDHFNAYLLDTELLEVERICSKNPVPVSKTEELKAELTELEEWQSRGRANGINH